jgi:hypothetical protein
MHTPTIALSHDAIMAIAAPINRTMPVPASAELLAFARAINAADESGMLPTIVKFWTGEETSVQPTAPKIADKKARKSQDSADWENRPASKKQLARINALCDNPLIWVDYYVTGELTAGEASKLYAEYKATIAQG